MTKVNDTAGLSKASGESLRDLGDRVECLITEYGFKFVYDFTEKEGSVGVHVYSGVGGQRLICKFPIHGRGNLVEVEDSGCRKNYDMFITFPGVPEKIVNDFIRDFVSYNVPKRKEGFKAPELLGVFKHPGENLSDFMSRLDRFLNTYGFNGSNISISDEKDSACKLYRGEERQTIEVTYNGESFVDSENTVDATLMFNEIPGGLLDRIHEGLKSKFIL